MTAGMETAPGAFWKLELIQVTDAGISRPPRAMHEAQQEPVGSSSGERALAEC